METILQFGTGRFLRGFFDPIVEQTDSIAVVQSRVNSSGAALINEATDGYHVWTRGKLDGKIVDQCEVVTSLSRGLVAHRAWDQLLTIAKSDDLKLVVSNTTEQGLALDDSDNSKFDFTEQCPGSYPAKLLALLYQRFQAGLPGLTILPMELVEYNASKLLSLVKQQAAIWPSTNDSEFLIWLQSDNRWLNNLVDRIVVGVSHPPPWDRDDPLAVVTEPFRMLTIEGIKDVGGPRDVLPDHAMIDWVEDLQSVFLRKVRILNGLHTAMVAHSLPQGFETVLDAVSDKSEREWLEGLLNDEILPALSSRGMEESQFAKTVMERFENPFFKHRLSGIANGHDKKLATRIQPTIEDFRIAFGRDPVKLCEVLSGDTSNLK